MGKKTKNWAVYKQDIPKVPEQQIMKAWAEHLGVKPGDRIGRWRVRPLTEVIWDPPAAKSWERAEGVLVKNGIQLDLYFHKRQEFDYEVLFARLLDHPFVDNCRYEKEKPKGQMVKAKGGGERYAHNDHLSPVNVGVRTTNNVATIIGYSKNGDGPPTADGKQMTHCWGTITHGRTGQTDGGEENYEKLANLMCEVCGFAMPFKGQFTVEGQMIHWDQPVYLTSAFGDIIPSAVGDIQPTSAVRDGDLPASSSN